MRKPLPPGSKPQDDSPPGGHAKDRARQFAQQRGLPLPPADVASVLPEAPASPPPALPPAPKPPAKKR